MNKWFSMKALANEAAEIAIFGDIGYGYSAADFYHALAALGKVTTLDVRINSHGGDVFQGFQIYNILKRFKGTVRVTADGLAASMASVIFMAGSERIMPENAQLMIHNPMGSIEGGSEQIKSFADALGVMEDNIVKAYATTSGVAEKIVRDMMNKESWLSATAAVAMGFATQIEGPTKMTARAYNLSRFHNVPQDFGTQPTQQEDEKMAVERDDEVKRICALVGKPALADGFIKEQKSVADVLKALDELAKTEAAAKATAEATARATAAAQAAAAEGKQPTTDEIRAQLLAEQQEVKALCNLAGMPGKADEFINARMSVKDVIAKLDTLRKEATAPKGNAKAKAAATDNEVHTQHNHRPNAGNGKDLDTVAVWDKFNNPTKARNARAS